MNHPQEIQRVNVYTQRMLDSLSLELQQIVKDEVEMAKKRIRLRAQQHLDDLIERSSPDVELPLGTFKAQVDFNPTRMQ